MILRGEIKTPPMSRTARLEAGFLLRQLQQETKLSWPHSRPMPSIGERYHELRIQDGQITWQIIYRMNPDYISLELFAKKTNRAPAEIMSNGKRQSPLYNSQI